MSVSLQAAKENIQAHQDATTSLGRAVAQARLEQDAATAALQAYRTELADKAARATEEQGARLHALRAKAADADKTLKELTREFKEARDKGEGMNESVMRQTERLQRLRSAWSRTVSPRATWPSTAAASPRPCATSRPRWTN